MPSIVLISSATNVIAVATAAVGVLAAWISQLAYSVGERAERPTHFGGAPIVAIRNEDSIHAEGTRERAGRKSAFYQSAATSLLVMTSFLQLSTHNVTKTVGAIVLSGLVIVFSLLGFRLLRWWREDRRLFAKMKYHMFHMPHEHLDVEEIKRLFAEQHPTLVVWL